MPIADDDLELLETYLDEALGADEVRSLRARLAGDMELSASLDELRAQRSLRQAVWQAIEPDQASADRLAWRMRGAMTAMQHQQHKRGWGQWQIARMGSAAAACAVIGFFVGWAGRGGHGISPAPEIGGSSVAVNSNSNPTSAVPAISNGGSLLVPVTNEYGQVVAWQPFDNSNDAKAFTEDLHKTRVPASDVPPDVRLTSEEKVKY